MWWETMADGNVSSLTNSDGIRFKMELEKWLKMKIDCIGGQGKVSWR
jgi:hypothetical protein